MNPRSLNNAGQIAFSANLADGRTVLVRADPDGDEHLKERRLPSAVTLTPSEAAPQLVGEPITWTATVRNASPGLVYQFSVGSPGGPFHVVRDFSPDNHFSLAPMQEGAYRIKVAVKDGFDAERTGSAVVTDRVDSRVTGDEAVISRTSNPLVALYCVPPGAKGTVHVEFAVAGDHPSWRSTNELHSMPGKSTNFLVAGMLPNTTYQMRHVFTDGTTSASLLFTTGALPSTLRFPSFTVRQQPGPGSDVDQDMIFHVLVGAVGQEPNPSVLATGLKGRVVWYYDSRGAEPGLALRLGTTLVAGDTVLVTGRDQHSSLAENVLREIDLAGDPVRETNLDAVNAQLKALGHDTIYGFGHDNVRLSNGDTVVTGYTERTVNIHGTPTDYLGDMVFVLDKDLQVTWAWDAFDHLDVNRGPVLGEVCHPGDKGPECVVPRLPAVDWLLVNAVSLSPADGNLVLSGRYQDWVIKIDYRNGDGDGHVIWRLGKDGDFKVNSTDPNPWFSHQHNAHYIDDTTLVLFDNGNTRRAADPSAHSRGQVWKLDEKTMTATLVLNIDLGVYSRALGAAQRLSNGNFSFTAGLLGQPSHSFGQTIEVRPDGSKAYVLEVNHNEFRSYRIRTLYKGTSELAGDGAGTSHHSDDSGDRSLGNRHRGDGPADPESPVADAELRAHHSTGTGVSRAAAGSSSDDFGPAVAAALTSLSRLLALPPTTTAAWAALAPVDVQRWDQLFAAGLEDGTSFVSPKSRRDPLSFGDEDQVDAVP